MIIFNNTHRFCDKIYHISGHRNVSELIYQNPRNVEIAFMCAIHNVVVFKFDLDALRPTDRYRK